MALTAIEKNDIRAAIPSPGAAQSVIAALDMIDGLTAGTALASHALVVDASGQIDTFITTANPTTTAGVGAKAGATVTAVEQGDGVVHRTVLTCAATPMTFGDEGGQGQFGGVKVYDFPEGLILSLGAVVDGSVTTSAPCIDNWDGDVGLGVAVVSDHQDAANKIGQILQSSAISAGASDKIAPTALAVSAATLLDESGARWRDGTGTAIDLYLNVLIDDDAAHNNTITGTFTGTITFAWINLGDIT